MRGYLYIKQQKLKLLFIGYVIQQIQDDFQLEPPMISLYLITTCSLVHIADTVACGLDYTVNLIGQEVRWVH